MYITNVEMILPFNGEIHIWYSDNVVNVLVLTIENNEWNTTYYDVVIEQIFVFKTFTIYVLVCFPERFRFCRQDSFSLFEERQQMKNKKNPLYQSVCKRNMNLRMLSSAWTLVMTVWRRPTLQQCSNAVQLQRCQLGLPLVLQSRVIQWTVRLLVCKL
jgi:hypothetical protein